ncbi:thioesterase [Acrocarpospora corrugata]|uniref:Thioesterase n=1 Tax=Acrocarpospora corrugata TaxID=35763 RepID=A0A5M3VV54_9ACTN|nr:alpha/beta fold hydrolase [Acrocarpospora corrugata]GES00667.1 thioesterase [Acrocarpospora corrugata]
MTARVYCFAHAGGSAGEFREWAGLAENVRIAGVERPGRGTRFAEPALTELTALVAEQADSLALDLPFGLFGHSFGALLVFEIAHTLRARGLRTPDWLWVSSFPSPDLARREPDARQLPDADLLRTLHRRHDAIPAEVLDNPELLEIVAAYMRADYTAMETHGFRDREPLPCDLRVLSGADEHDLHDRLAGWEKHVTGAFSMDFLPGGHFYLRDPDNRHHIVQAMNGIWTPGVER